MESEVSDDTDIAEDSENDSLSTSDPDDDLQEELETYQIPESSTQEEVTEYVKFYVKMSEGKVFYRGWIQPDLETRARIYRTIISLNLLHPELNFINLNTSYGIVLKHSPIEIEIDEEFDRLYEASLGKILVPKGCEMLSQDDFHYYRRLLNCFVSDMELTRWVQVLMNTELNTYVLFLSFTSGHCPSNLGDLWNQYCSGGIEYTIKLQPEHLLSACSAFSWEVRSKWALDSEDDSILLTVRMNSRKQFQKLYSRLVAKEKLIRHDVSEVLQNEDSAFGLLRSLRGPTVAIPIIGTRSVYVDKPVTDIRLSTDISFDQDEVETYSQDKFSEMDPYRKASLVEGPSGKWFSFLNVYQNARRIDPTNREDFSSEANQEIEDVYNGISSGIGRAFLTGFPPVKLIPELIQILRGRNIFFYLKTGDTYTWFWEIPDFTDTDYEEIGEYAIEILTKKWSDSSSGLFQSNYVNSEADRLLIFSPKALKVFETSRLTEWSRNIDEQANRVRNEAIALSNLY